MRESRRTTANAAAKTATHAAQDSASLRAERAAGEVDAIYRRRWGAFLKSPTFDTRILLGYLDHELNISISGHLSAQVVDTAGTTLGTLAKAIPADALLVIHKRPIHPIVHPLHESIEQFAAFFASASTDKIAEAAYQFIKLPSLADVTRIVFAPFNGETWTQRLRNWIPQSNDIALEVANGISLGKSRQEIARALLPIVENSRVAAVRIARTETHRVNVTAQMQSMTQALGPAIEEWIYTATDDARVSPEHWALNGTRYKRGEPKPLLPSRPNCFVAGTAVRGAFVGGLEAFYSGPIVELQTRSGRTLAVTPNHAVLTSEGWSKAGKLREGNYLACHGSGIECLASSPYDQHVPSAIEKVTQAFRAHGLLSTQASHLDLHGDAEFVDGQIDVVGSDRFLQPDGLEPFGFESGDDFAFPLPDMQGVQLALKATSTLRHPRILLPASRSVRGSHLFGSSGVAHPGPLQSLRCGLPAWFDSTPKKLSADDATVDPTGVGHFLLALSGEVSLDRIVSIKRRAFSGHVFDLQSTRGWYLANGVISSNCRCVYRPGMKAWESFGLPPSVAASLRKSFPNAAAA
jgi:SPP1 gp7 family putative phage head morphogenesis protein